MQPHGGDLWEGSRLYLFAHYKFSDLHEALANTRWFRCATMRKFSTCSMSENLISKLVPHQGCVITTTGEGIEIAGSAMNWVMSAAVAPFVCRAPFTFRVVGKTDSTNLRMHWHRGELIFNWECSVRELRVHDPATAKQHGLEDKGFITTNEWHEISWEIRLDRMRVVVDGEIRFETEGDYSGIQSAPSVGPCFGSTVSVREFSITPFV